MLDFDPWAWAPWEQLLGNQAYMVDINMYIYIIFVARSGNGVSVVFAICFFAVANMHFWIAYTVLNIYVHVEDIACI